MGGEATQVAGTVAVAGQPAAIVTEIFLSAIDVPIALTVTPPSRQKTSDGDAWARSEAGVPPVQRLNAR